VGVDTQGAAVTKAERDELRALLAKATPGEWRVSMTGYSVKSDDAVVPIVAAVHGGAQATLFQIERWLPNADLIAAARNAIGGLLDQLDAADETIAALREDLEDALPYVSEYFRDKWSLGKSLKKAEEYDATVKP
jgi:hypothetical protein